MSSSEDLPPIVFVPGWKASVLVDKKTGEEKYPFALSHLVTGRGGGGVLDLPMEWDDHDGTNKTPRQVQDDLEASHPWYDVKACCFTFQIYGPMIRHLQQSSRDVHLFAYDWRRELGETSERLEKFLEQFKTKKPQVIAHSLGGLFTLECLNRRPELFHSVLWGACVFSPCISILADYSFVGGINKLINNSEIFTPASHLTNPSAIHMLQMYPDEREAFGMEHTALLYDAKGKPIHGDLEFRKLSTWKKFKVGMYHPESQIEVTTAKEAWFQSVLDRCCEFRAGLVPDAKTRAKLPPTAVLNSDGLPTKFACSLADDGTIDVKNMKTLPGDGRLIYEDSVPPRGIPVIQKITTKGGHLKLLNDVASLDKLLNALLDEVDKGKK